MNRNLILFVLLAAALTLAACSQEGPAPAQAATRTPPPLPADVQQVADSMNKSAATTTAAVASDKFTAPRVCLASALGALAEMAGACRVYAITARGFSVAALLALESEYQRRKYSVPRRIFPAPVQV